MTPPDSAAGLPPNEGDIITGHPGRSVYPTDERDGSWDTWPWRNGRKVGRTIYAQGGAEPSDDDVLIGLMDSTWYAEIVCRDHNLAYGYTEDGYDR